MSETMTILSPGTVVLGDLRTPDPVEVWGRVEGAVTSGAVLRIHAGGSVAGPVAAVDIVVEGAVEGAARASGRVEIGSQGRLAGDIRAAALVVHPGGSFRGQVDITGDAAPADDAGEIALAEPQEPEDGAASQGGPAPVESLDPPDDVVGAEPAGPSSEEYAEVLSPAHRVSTGAGRPWTDEVPPTQGEPALLTQRPSTTTEEQIEAALLRRGSQGSRG